MAVCVVHLHPDVKCYLPWWVRAMNWRGLSWPMNRFGTKLRELRLARGMTLEEVGDVVSVTKSAVGQWEKGRTVPELPKLIELARFFRTTLAEMTGNTEQEASIDSELRLLDPDTAEILRQSFLASIERMKSQKKS